jgi:hypothetical protein
VRHRHPIPPDAFLARADDVMSAESDDELVMMRLEADHYYGLDPIGRRVWELLAEPATAAALCCTLCDEFEVDEGRCLAELLPFLGELAAEGIVRVEHQRPA